MMQKIRPIASHYFPFYFLSLLVSLFVSQTYGQKTILKNSVDESLSIKTITVAPMIDNVSQIYARPLSSQLRNIVESDRQWDLRTYPDSIKSSPEEFEDNPGAVKAALQKAGTDALLSSRLIKGPHGISIKLNLFLAKDGLLLAQENLQNYSGFEIADLRSQLEVLYSKLKSHLPYSGTILSRKNQQVTVNLGSQQGLTERSELSVIQIIKVNRHPRFKFVVSAEKEIIGRIDVDKVEKSLSFGTLTLERSENVVQPGMKVMLVDFVEYPQALKSADGKIMNELSQRQDSQLTLGDRPREWVPQEPPSLGQFAFMLGLGSYSINNTLETVGAISGSNMPTPSIHLDGELWLTKNWFVNLGLKQYILSIGNSYGGSSPGQINVSSSQTTLQFGYNFLLQEEFFGPKFQLLAGYSDFSSTVDTSTPTAFTSMDFSGLAIGVGGSFPVAEEVPLSLGAKMMFYLNPTVSESPVHSGSSSSGKMTSFAAFGTYKWTEHINLRGELMYDLFSASFSGTGNRIGDPSASSASHGLTTFAAGIEYLF